MGRPAKQPAIEFDELEQSAIEPCRDERCPMIGLHPLHPVVGRRGRTTNSCPNCFKPTKRINRRTITCVTCGWSRTRKKT